VKDKVVQIGVAGYPFSVEVVETPKERAHGLMGRKHLPDGTGMLFKMRGGPAQFHMKNTLVPLDILFFDESGTVLKRDVMQPHIGRSYCNGDIHSVLELPMGTCDFFDIKVGDKMTSEHTSHDSLLNNLIKEILLAM